MARYKGEHAVISYTEEEIDEARKDELARLPERYGSVEAAEEQFINVTGIHEVMHLVYVLCETFENYALTSPVCVLNPTAWRIGHDAHVALFNLYQALGRIEYDLMEKSK